MATQPAESIIFPELIRELRVAANHGANVRELTQILRNSLSYPEDAFIPIMTGFYRAFGVPLVKLLPLCDWLDENNDAEIDAQILPEIEATRHVWAIDIDEVQGNGSVKQLQSTRQASPP